MEERKKFICPKCGNPACEEGDAFCFNCGASLKNYCSNDNCVMNNGEDIELPLDCCFCTECGEETTFMKAGYIKPKDFSEK